MPAAVLAVLLTLGCAGRADVPALPSFALTDQSGRTVRAEDLRGRALVVSFVFTTCVEACPILTAQLRRAQAEVHAAGLADRVRFVSITVDPATDTPVALRRYAEAHGADLATWSFLTGPPEEIAGVTGALGVGTAPGKRGLAHDTPVLFVDGAGRVVERHRALELPADTALAKIRRLLG